MDAQGRAACGSRSAHAAVTAESSVAERGSRRLAAVLLLLVGVLAYSNAVTNRFIGIDTLQAVRDNPDIRSLTPLSRALSLTRTGQAAANDNSTLVRRPVLSLSFALNHALTGSEAWGFQVGNIAIHLTAGLLLFGVARRTLSRLEYRSRHATWLGFAIAAIFISHPLQTESVTNIVQRAESLMGCFVLLVLYGAIRSWEESDGAATRRRWSVATVIGCTIGMGAKEMMIAAPLLVWIYDAVFVSGGWREALRRRPRFYAALAATWVVLAVLILATWSNAAREFDSARMLPYVLSQLRVVVHYLRLSFWPDPLYHYVLGTPFWFDPSRDRWLSLAPHAAIVVALSGVTAWGLLYRRPVGFLGAWFFLPLLPTSLAATFTLIQEHRMYLSLAAVVALVAVFADAAIRHGVRRLGTKATAASALILIAVLGGLIAGTRWRNQDYRSDLTLWAPDDLPLAFTMLSNLSVYNGRWHEADEVLSTLLRAALAAKPGEPFFKLRPAAYNGLGVVRACTGRWDEARNLFERALGEQPSYTAAKNNLGVVLFAQGERAAAQQPLAEVMAADPRYDYLALRGDGPARTLWVPLLRATGHDHRDGVIAAGLEAFALTIALNPPDEEFAMDFELGLKVALSAPVE